MPAGYPYWQGYQSFKRIWDNHMTTCKYIAAALLLTASTISLAAKPGTEPPPSETLTYGYVGTTSTPIMVACCTVPSVFDLNEICQGEFGAQAKLARSSEIATAIDLNSFLPHETLGVIIHPEGVAGVGGNNNLVMDRYLPGYFDIDTNWLTVLPTGQFSGISFISPREYLVACSAPQ
jgi:hypothetical protein